MRIGKVADQSEYDQVSGLLDQDAGFNLNEEDDDFKRFLPAEFLKKLPGVTQSNIADLVMNVKNLSDLCSMPE